MPKKRLKKLTEAGFIPGIYNFCDHWCEKCPRKSGCLSYVMGKKLGEKENYNLKDALVPHRENVWELLRNIFDSTYEVLHDLAVEQGVDVEEIYTLENMDEELLKEEEYMPDEEDEEEMAFFMESSDIIKLCLIYEELSGDTLDEIFGILDEKVWPARSRGEKITSNALDVINWHLDIIQIKMRRALQCQYQAGEQEMTGENEKDSDGSAKVALLCIEQSVKAWKTLKRHCPTQDKEISHILVILDLLVQDIEKQFKNARTFVRPGFDE